MRDKEGGMRRVKEWKEWKFKKRMKNEKVAKGRIIGLAGPCFQIHLESFFHL